MSLPPHVTNATVVSLGNIFPDLLKSRCKSHVEVFNVQTLYQVEKGFLARTKESQTINT